MAIGYVIGVAVSQTGAALMARLRGNAGALITKTSLSTITYVATNLTLGTSAAAVALTIGSVVFDALQQSDPRWTVDSVDRPGSDGSYGYNFLAVIPASTFPLGVFATPLPGMPIAPPAPAKFQVDVVMTPTTGEPFRMPFQFPVLPVYG